MPRMIGKPQKYSTKQWTEEFLNVNRIQRGQFIMIHSVTRIENINLYSYKITIRVQLRYIVMLNTKSVHFFYFWTVSHNYYLNGKSHVTK